MRGLSILIVIVVVLSLVRQAEAANYGVTIGKYRYSIVDVDTQEFMNPARFSHQGKSSPRYETIVFLGPLGPRNVPFTATQGLVGFCLILALLVILPAVVVGRWKWKRAVK